MNVDIKLMESLEKNSLQLVVSMEKNNVSVYETLTLSPSESRQLFTYIFYLKEMCRKSLRKETKKE